MTLGWKVGRLPRISPQAMWMLLAVYVVFRLYLATLPGYANDVDSYKRWALGAVKDGLAMAYERTGIDYPPLFLYVLYGLGKVYLWIRPEATVVPLTPDPLLTLFVKLPHVVSDLLLGGLLAWVVTRWDFWRRGPEAADAGRWAALAYLWNPAVLFGSGYWGQPDGVHSLLAVLALALLIGGRVFGAGVALSAAGLMKPLAAPLVPLFAVAATLRYRQRGFVAAAGGGLTAAILVFLPFAFAGRLEPVLRRVLLDVEAMPFTSVNGHNLWWILGAWRPANAPLLGPLTPKVIALTLFLAAYAWILYRCWPWMRRQDLGRETFGPRLFLAAACVTSVFFFVSTHMHENHLFLALPLLIAVAGRQPQLTLLAALASACVFANMALHDLDLPYHLPLGLSAPSSVTDPHLGRPYTWLQVFGSFANAVLAGWLAGSVLYRLARKE